MFANPKDLTVKVIEFGYAQKAPRWLRYLHKEARTLEYSAPELQDLKYNKEADLWSIGVILYAMFYGYTPFKACKRSEVKELIRDGFRGCPEGKISFAGKDIVNHLLVSNVAERFDAHQALMHKWFDVASSNNDIPVAVVEQLKKSSSMDKFKVLVSGIFQNEDLLQTAQLRKYFMKLDKNNDNRISYREFKDYLKKFSPNLHNREIAQLFENIDIDGDKFIQFDEFTRIIGYHQLINVYERLQLVFNKLDSNGNGYLDKGDIPILELEMDKDPLISRLNIDPVEVIESADLNNDGMVSFEEFLFAMHPELVEPEKRIALDRSKRYQSKTSGVMRQNSFDKKLTSVWKL